MADANATYDAHMRPQPEEWNAANQIVRSWKGRLSQAAQNVISEIDLDALKREIALTLANPDRHGSRR